MNKLINSGNAIQIVKSNGVLSDNVPEMSENVPDLAVSVQDGCLAYGRGKKAFQALNGVKLQVPKGAIYGLLGPSGCGKTTLLNTVVGLLTLDKGTVQVFGHRPGSSKGSIPGRGVGFMPQELALYSELTIGESLTFFGNLQQMDPKSVKERVEFLLEFLDLPSKDKLITKLSGGQQRRVSLAGALIHKPPLLILDEPTVGVDPLLRQTIWDYLIGLSSNENMTIVVTTHYISEASQANIVGFMRQGQMLVQGNPKKIMDDFKENCLEKCFLNMCKKRDDTNDDENLKTLNVVSTVANEQANSNENSKLAIDEDPICKYVVKPEEHVAKLSFPKSKTRIPKLALSRICNSIKNGILKTWVIFCKNMIRFKRNPLLLFFQLFLPCFLLGLFNMSIGPPPFDLQVAIVNLERAEGSKGIEFLQTIDPYIMIQRPYPDLASALESVQNGDNWGVLYIGEGFTDGLSLRFENCLAADMQAINNSIIRVYLDYSSQHVAFGLQATLMQALENFTRQSLDSIGVDQIYGELPIKFENPVYGKKSGKFSDFITPGTLINLTYFMAMAMTVMVCLEERKNGTLNRCWVSGVNSVHILSAQLFVEFVVVVFQVLAAILFTVYVSKSPMEGNAVIVFMLMTIQAFYGMSLGLLVASIVTNENLAMMVIVAAFYPSVLLSGILWPIEGQNYVLRYVSLCIPQTLPTEAVRAVMFKGWGMDRTVVWSSFLVMLGWAFACLVIASICFARRK